MSLDDIFISDYYYIPFFIISIILICICGCSINYCYHKYKKDLKLPKYTKLKDFLHYHKSLKEASCKIHPISFENDCIICFHTPSFESFMTLDCKHKLHSHCIVNWWKSQPSAFASCPMCRHVSNICLLEVKHSHPEEFVGFYRNDNSTKVFIRLNYTHMTDFIAIKNKAKKHAQETSMYIYQQASLFSRSISFTQQVSPI